MGIRLPLQLALGLAVLTAGCGSAPSVGDGPDSGGEGSAASAPAVTGSDATSDGAQVLTVRVTGLVAEGALCPGGQRPCFTLDGEVEPDDAGAAQVVGELSDGVLRVTAQEPVPDLEPDFGDRCDGMTGGGDDFALREQVDAFTKSIPDVWVTTWISPRQIVHVGVVGDTEPYEEALSERGLAGKVCLVGGLPLSDAELTEVQNAVSAVMQRWAEEGETSMSSSRDDLNGKVMIDIHKVDAARKAELQGDNGDVVEVRAAIEVLDGSLADLDAALAEAAASDTGPGPYLACGAVRFSTIPADPGEFPAIDAEASSAMDEAMGPMGGVASVGFSGDVEWSIAERTGSRLVLFGRTAAGTPSPGPTTSTGDGGGAGYVVLELRRHGEQWTFYSSGGCVIRLEALGLGPATMILDPDRRPDPASTEVSVLIQELSCASGEAPVDREVVPVVTETATTVEIGVLVAPVIGGAECPSNPWFPLTVTLAAPLGDRTVIDAGVQPGLPRTWPPPEYDGQG